MNYKILVGIVGILLIALVGCKKAEVSPPQTQEPQVPEPATLPPPAPTVVPTPEPQPQVVASEEKNEGVTREKRIYETTTGKEPVPTESKFTGPEGSFVSSVECGVKEDLATVSVAVTNPTKDQLWLGDRPQVFESGGEMIGLRLNGRYVLDYLECKDYDKEAGLKPGDKVACMATVPPDSNKEKVLIRHAPNSLGNPTPNILFVYSPSGGREQVTFEC